MIPVLVVVPHSSTCIIVCVCGREEERKSPQAKWPGARFSMAIKGLISHAGNLSPSEPGSHRRHFSRHCLGQCRETLTWPDIRGRTAPRHAPGRGRCSQPLHQLTIRLSMARPAVELANAQFIVKPTPTDESRPSEIEKNLAGPLSSRPHAPASV